MSVATEQDKKYDELQKIGANAMSCIADMVAALECDYDRLEELRGERSDYKSEEHAETWEVAFPDESTELAELEAAAGGCTSREDAEQRIQEDPLSLEVRSGWTSPGEPLEAEEFCLLLSTGGPATRIVGEIRNGQAYRPRLEAQDWFTPWTEYADSDRDILESYCNVVCCFQ